VVGCSPACPNPGGAQSGYLVEAGEGSVLLDCGPGVLARLRDRDGWPAADAIVLTHFHLDHFGDLVPWVWGALFLEGLNGEVAIPELWLPPGGTARLEHFAGLLGFAGKVEHVFAVSEYAPDMAFHAGGFTITAAAVPHYQIDAFALRLTGDGRTLAYSGDSAPSGALVSIARGADLFLCEATLRSGDEDGEPRGHLSVDEAWATCEEAAAGELLLTHRPAELAAPADLQLAHDGLVRSV
jgi:ribonuclease BN (tRNA processing enzyme)